MKTSIAMRPSVRTIPRSMPRLKLWLFLGVELSYVGCVREAGRLVGEREQRSRSVVRTSGVSGGYGGRTGNSCRRVELGAAPRIGSVTAADAGCAHARPPDALLILRTLDCDGISLP